MKAIALIAHDNMYKKADSQMNLNALPATWRDAADAG
jgi:hypothetical protein